MNVKKNNSEKKNSFSFVFLLFDFFLYEMVGFQMGRISPKILDGKEFMSGYWYHRQKAMMEDIKTKKKRPVVFHMNWTLNSKEKLERMREMGMWFLSDDDVETCQNVSQSVDSEKAVDFSNDKASLSAFQSSYGNKCCKVK